MSLRFNLIAFFLILTVTPISAQIVDLKEYEFKEAEASGAINTIRQFNDGQLWLGMKERGLIQFDGRSENVFDNGNAFFKDDEVKFIYQDSKDQIWISTASGGIGILKDSGIEYQFEENTIDNQVVVAMAEYSNGNLVFYTELLGTYSYNEIDGLLTIEDERTDNRVNDAERINGEVWLATSQGVLIYSLDRNAYTKSIQQLEGLDIYSITETGEGVILGSSDGLHIITENIVNSVSEINGNRLSKVYDVEENPNGGLLLSTSGLGLISYDSSKDSYSEIFNWDERPLGRIEEIYLDQSKNVWFISETGSLYLWKNRSFSKLDSRVTGGFKNFYSIYIENDTTVWYGTDNGLIRHNPAKKTLDSHFPLDGKAIWDITKYQGELLVLANDTTLYTFRNNDYREKKLFDFGNNLIIDIEVLENGDLWVGTDNGLIYEKDGRFEKIDSETGLSDDFIWHIYEDSKSVVWISTNRGITKYSAGNFQIIEELKQAGYDGQFRFSDEDNNGDIWFGSMEGIIHYFEDEENEGYSVRRFNNDDGLLVLDTQFLTIDQNNNLWHGTSAGIQSLNIDDYKLSSEPRFTHYSLSENGFGVSTYHNAVALNGKKLFFGSKDGLFKLNTDITFSETNGPLLFIENLSSFRRTDQNILQETNIDASRFSSEGQVLTLASSENDLKVVVKGIDFADPGKIQYSYKFDRPGANWTRFQSEPEIRFLNLEPGDYNIVIKAKGLDGYESSYPVNLAVTVVAPFWKTSWFYGFVVILLIGVYYVIDKIKYQLYERDHFKILVEERTQNLSNALAEKEILLQEVHHRIKNNLAVISGLLQLQTINIKNEEAQRILNESQLRIKSIALIHEKLYQNDTLANINFQKYIEELVHIIADSYNFEGKDIELELEVENINITLDQSIPCGLILNELVSNSYEHAFKGRAQGAINITFKELKDGNINFVIKDNGIGFPDDYSMETSTSLGVTLVHTLVAQLQGELHVNGKVGTEYNITFNKEGY